MSLIEEYNVIAEIVNNIKARLGATHRKLELSDEQIVELLQRETLSTLSIYFPFYVEYLLDLQTDRVEGQDNLYALPEYINGEFRVIGVEKVIPSYISQAGMTTGWYGLLGGDLNTAMVNYMNVKLAAGVTSMMLPPETFQFIAPNLLRIFNTLQHTKAFVVLRTTHRLDFSTLPYGTRETVMKLAMADVALDLLGIRNYFQQIGTTFAEINLNVDQLRDWADRREDLIEQMRLNQLRNFGAKKIWVV